jgi:hypothetical protein
LWATNLIAQFIGFNSYNYSYSLHRFKTHKPETYILVRYHFTSYIIVYILAVSLLLTDCFALQIVLLPLLTVPICVCSSLRVFRQASREHLVEGFGLSVVTKTTPPLCRQRLSICALSRERVYNCHPDNDSYSALIVAVV